MSPVIVIVPLPAMNPNMSSTPLPVGVHAAAFLPRALVGEEPAFFTAVIFLGFAILHQSTTGEIASRTRLSCEFLYCKSIIEFGQRSNQLNPGRSGQRPVD